MQSKLLEVFRAAPGQVIVVTHSAQLLPTYAHEFQCVYRMQKSHLGTQIFSLEKTFAGQQDKLENELRASSDVAALLFANAVLLAEGGTEIGAFNEWFPQSSASQGETFAALNIILHAVGGKAEFPFYIRFLTAFAIPWGVICDGDALPPSKSPNDKLWKVLKELQLIPELPDVKTDFDVLREKAASCGIYTYNMSALTKFETIPEVKHYLDKEWVPPGKTAYRGRSIAIHVPCPPVVHEVFQQLMERLTVQ